MRNRPGFTRIETAAVLFVITLVIGLCLFGYVRTVQKGEQAACATCRTLLVRLYQTHILAGCDCTLAEAAAGECETFNKLITGTGCPTGGVYTAIGDDALVCSRHG